MDHFARLNLLKTAEIVSTTRGEISTKTIRRLLMAAIVGIAALAIIAEARATPNDWPAFFVNCCSRV